MFTIWIHPIKYIERAINIYHVPDECAQVLLNEDDTRCETIYYMGRVLGESISTLTKQFFWWQRDNVNDDRMYKIT